MVKLSHRVFLQTYALLDKSQSREAAKLISESQVITMLQRQLAKATPHHSLKSEDKSEQTDAVEIGIDEEAQELLEMTESELAAAQE